MSFDAEDVMKRAACPKCGECCEDYEPGVSSVTVDGLMYHPRCVVSAEYAREVHDLLTKGNTQTRLATEHPLLSDEESEELVANFLLGVPAKVFAGKLECRDIAAFDVACESAAALLFQRVADQLGLGAENE